MKWIRTFRLASSSNPLAQPVIPTVSTAQASTLYPADASPSTTAHTPNPASAGCIEQRFKSEIRTAEMEVKRVSSFNKALSIASVSPRDVSFVCPAGEVTAIPA